MNALPPAPGPIRLGYTLTAAARSQRTHLAAHAPEAPDVALAEAEVRAMRRRLHPLDVAIVQELCASQMFGHLTDSQVARLLPLLAQRRTAAAGSRLRLAEGELTPRLSVEPTAAGMRLTMQLVTRTGASLPLDAGRLLCGPQAYFLREALAYVVRSGAPWLLARWALEPSALLAGDQLGATNRDRLVKELASTGIPEVDLLPLAVHRAPPRRFRVALSAGGEGPDGPLARAQLHAEYADGEAQVEEKRAAVAYLVAPSGSLAERDMDAEEGAREALGVIGFRYDRDAQCFVASGEAALAALDPSRDVFPGAWAVERAADAPVFHRDLRLSTRIKMLEDRGLLDLEVAVEHHNGGTAAAAAAHIDLKALLAWLKSGQRYVRLRDGSYAAPSPRLRQGLKILRELGADGERALISPLCIGLLRAMGNEAGLAAADDATRAWLAELASTEGPEPMPAPPGLEVELRDYQRRGLDWLLMLHRHRLTGILADDMGLGKTLQTLALLLAVRAREGQRPSLVVAPTSVIGVWRDEAARFAPDLRVALWYGPPAERHAIDPRAYDLVVTSYGVLRRDAERFAQITFRYVILDEAQSAKNASSHNAAAIRRLHSERRLALSGTPLENRPEELWSVFDFLAPGFLGTLRQFRRRYALPIARGEADPLALLRLRMQPLVLRRLKGEVARELPDKVESVVRCEMNEAQRALYDMVAGELRESVSETIARVGIERAQLDILAALTRLRQICCDPALLPVPPGTRVPPSAKLALFEQLMREALASGRTVVVFSQFVEMQRRLIAVLRELGVEPLWLHGGSTHRDQIVAKFQDPEGPPVIVVSLRAGGTGVTLTRADTVVHYDPWWNPAVERQATDRAHRLGQRQTVSVYKLLCARSIEERVLKLAQDKEGLARALLGSEGGSAAKRISREDVLALLS